MEYDDKRLERSQNIQLDFHTLSGFVEYCNTNSLLHTIQLK